jgi:plasmid stabilization system protein ParE
MPQLALRFTAQAHRDLSSIYSHLEPISTQATAKFIIAIERAVRRLQDHPFSMRKTNSKFSIFSFLSS